MQEKRIIKDDDTHGIIATLMKKRVLFRSAFSLPLIAANSLRSKFCCRSRKNKEYTDLFNKGEERFYEELDIVNLLKTVRLTKVFVKTYFNRRQRLLLEL